MLIFKFAVLFCLLFGIQRSMGEFPGGKFSFQFQVPGFRLKDLFLFCIWSYTVHEAFFRLITMQLDRLMY